MLWEYGGYASDGVKQVAQLGSPVKMEEEIRQKVRPSGAGTDAVRMQSQQIDKQIDKQITVLPACFWYASKGDMECSSASKLT